MKFNKTFLIIFFVVVIGGLFIWSQFKSPINNSQITKIGVLLYTEHKVINEIFSGFKDEIYKEAEIHSLNIELVVKNANADQVQLRAITNYFSSNDEIKSIIVIGTPAAKFLKDSNFSKPVIFAGVPDPIGAGLITSLENHNSNFSGTTYFPPTDKIIDIFTDNYHLKERKVAVLRNPSESNSVAVTDAFNETLKEKNIELVDFPVIDGSDIDASLKVIKNQNIDGLFIPTDNLVYSRLNNVVNSLKENQIPIFSCTELSVIKGADFALGTDYKSVGLITASKASKVLFGKQNIESLNVFKITEGYFYVNTNSSIIKRKIRGYQTKIIK